MKGWMAALLARLRRVAPERLLLVILALVVLGLWLAVWRVLPRPLEVTALSVGDGDSYLIRAPSGRCVLLDGGSRSRLDIGAEVLVPNLLLLGVRRLDAVIISHPDADHVNGLPDVLDALPVARVLDPHLPGDNTDYQQIVEVCKENEIPRYRLRAGGQINIDRHTRLRVLAPGPRLLSGTSSDTNNNTLVCLLEFGSTRMLLTGDLEAEGEAALLARTGDLRADVLTAAHHGSRTGTSEALLNAVRPRVVVISSRGSEQHPHEDTLRRLRDRGIRILRTDVHGQVRLRSDGRTWRTATFRHAAVR
jgi:competence protein ComEC